MFKFLSFPPPKFKMIPMVQYIVIGDIKHNEIKLKYLFFQLPNQ